MRDVDEETHLHLIDFFLMFFVSAFYFKLGFILLRIQKKRKTKVMKPAKVAKKMSSAHQVLYQIGRTIISNAEGIGFHFAIAVGCFDKELIGSCGRLE